MYDEIKVVDLEDNDSALVIIDQTKLPGVVEYLYLKEKEEIWEAIKALKVRGAPAIGVAAGFGIYLCAKKRAAEMFGSRADGVSISDADFDRFLATFRKDKDYLNSSRPTAVNLSWALNRMEERLLSMRKAGLSGGDLSGAGLSAPGKELTIAGILNGLKEESLAIKKEDEDTNRAIGEHALSLLKPGMGLLTHCNAGVLATTKYGTATAAMYLGHERGYNFRIYCDETRPLLQGARLTAWELSRAGMDVTLQCDNMVPSLMKEGKIDAVLVGCDRVAANGDVANKIGTSYVALAAARYGIPFYVCAPSSTIDLDTLTGADIVIEQRDPDEVTTAWYSQRMAPEDIKVYNPAFDVTPAQDIKAIITEKGIFKPGKHTLRRP